MVSGQRGVTIYYDLFQDNSGFIPYSKIKMGGLDKNMSFYQQTNLLFVESALFQFQGLLSSYFKESSTFNGAPPLGSGQHTGFYNPLQSLD
jgi:hypothetical protein